MFRRGSRASPHRHRLRVNSGANCSGASLQNERTNCKMHSHIRRPSGVILLSGTGDQAIPFANAQPRSRHTQRHTDTHLSVTCSPSLSLSLTHRPCSTHAHGECPLGPFPRLLPFPSFSVDAQRQSHCGVRLRWGSDGVLLEIVEDSVSHILPGHLH